MKKTTWWWSGSFGVERICTCRDRSAECGAAGFHLVDSSDDRGAALGEADRLRRAYGVAYRVVERRTGTVAVAS